MLSALKTLTDSCQLGWRVGELNFYLAVQCKTAYPNESLFDKTGVNLFENPSQFLLICSVLKIMKLLLRKQLNKTLQTCKLQFQINFYTITRGDGRNDC